MTKKENFISMMAKEFRLSDATSKAIYEASDKLFKENDTAKYNSFKNCYSPHFQKVIEAATQYMKDSNEYSIEADMNEEIVTCCS
jgi:plasmid replication initiation protein